MQDGNETLDALIADLLLSIEARAQTYDEVMSAWRTSCPKLPVWEDANDRGFVEVEGTGGQSMVRVTDSGRAFLAAR